MRVETRCPLSALTAKVRLFMASDLVATRRSSFAWQLTLICLLLPGSSQAQTLEDRITSIINQMTIDEKIKQLHAEGGGEHGGQHQVRHSRLCHGGWAARCTGWSGDRFSVGIGMAAMWDTAMARRIGIAR